MASSKEGALSALEKIRRQRRGEAKATEQYEVRDENAEIFATVSAEEYAELKQTRRAGNWIEGDEAEGYSDDGEEWWESGSDRDEVDSSASRWVSKRQADATGSPRKEGEGRRKKQKAAGAAAAAESRAQGMRSLLQHFSSMASDKGSQRRHEGQADSAKQLQALKSIEASLDLDEEEDEEINTHANKSSSRSKSSISSSSSSSSRSGRPVAASSSGPLAAANGFGVFGLGAGLPVRVPGGLGPSALVQLQAANSKASADSAEAPENSAVESAGTGNEVDPAAVEGGVVLSAASEGEEASSLSAGGDDPERTCGIFESTNEHFLAPRKMEAIDIFAEGEETVKAGGTPGGSPMSDEAMGTNEGLPLCADGTLPFYFLDAWDDAAAGVVYLFGKVWRAATAPPQEQPGAAAGAAGAAGPPQSCCVVVKKMMRPLIFFLRKQVSLCVGLEEEESEAVIAERLQQQQQNAKEFLQCDGLRLKSKYQWHTWKCKPTKRHFAFDAPGLPRERDLQVVKVFCPGTSPPFEAEDLQGLTYSHVVGSRVSLTEALLIKRKIKGPCWLRISGFSLPPSPADKASWCRYEVLVDSHKQIQVWSAPQKPVESESSAPAQPHGRALPAPPLTILSLTAKAVTISNNPAEDRAVCLAAFFVEKDRNIEDGQAEPTLRKENVFCAVRRVRSGGAAEAPKQLPPSVSVYARSMVAGIPPSFEEAAKAHQVQVYDSERLLLTNLINRVYVQDPDIIMGHNLYGADLELLARRCHFHGLPLWHKLSRLKRPKTQKPPCSSTRQQHQQTCLWGGRLLTVGRLVCDTYLQARELLSHRTNYNLLSLLREAFPLASAAKPAGGGAAGSPSKYHLRIAREVNRMVPLHCEDLLGFFWIQDSSRLLYAANLCCLEAYMSSVLAQRLNCLAVTKELSVIAGNLWARSLQNARAERNAYLLMHVLHAEKFVYPDPPLPRSKAAGLAPTAAFEEEPAQHDTDAEAGGVSTPGTHRSKSSAYAGGLVLEPRVGLYDSYVLLLDFNSLYPSIIQEFNVCFSTVRRPQKGAEGDALQADDQDEEVLGIDQTPGILPRVLQQLVEKRRHVKAAAKKETDAARRASLDVKQLALKLTANSIYGCLGFSGSRFYARPLAAYITQQGRAILRTTKDKVEQQLRLSVLYGDTDSIMVDTGLRDEGRGEAFSECLRLGQRIKAEVNKQYKKLEIDLEAVFRRLLLLRKKKYACCIVEDYHKRQYKIEQKGLDFVRRDWALLTKQAGEQLLRIIFGVSLLSAPGQQQQQQQQQERAAGDTDAVDTVVSLLHDRLRAMRETLVSGKAPLDLFVITKALTKSPQLYAQGSGGAAQPHVLVALRMLAAGRPVRAGNEIPYIICDEASIKQAEEKQQRQHQHRSPSPGEAAAAEQQQQQQRIRSPAERAFHPSEVQNLGLKPDVEYYIQNQLFPPVQRLCAHVQGTSSARIAECLGLNPARFGDRELGEDAADDPSGETERQQGEDRILALIKKSDEAFKTCNIPAQIPCGLCGVWGPAAQALRTSRCSSCGGWLSPSALRDTLRLYLSYIRHTFHIHLTRCTECKHKFEFLPPGPLTAGASLRCPLCEGGRVVDCVSPHDLYVQLQHLRFLLSQDSTSSSRSSGSSVMRVALDSCHAAVPLPVEESSAASVRQQPGGESLRKASQSKHSSVLVKKGLELKFPLVVAALRYLRSVKAGVVSLSAETERKDLMEPVAATMNVNALNTLNLQSVFCALRPPAAADFSTRRWALLAASYSEAKSSAVEAKLPPDSGVKGAWGGSPPAVERNRSRLSVDGLRGFGMDSQVPLKRELY